MFIERTKWSGSLIWIGGGQNASTIEGASFHKHPCNFAKNYSKARKHVRQRHTRPSSIGSSGFSRSWKTKPARPSSTPRRALPCKEGSFYNVRQLILCDVNYSSTLRSDQSQFQNPPSIEEHNGQVVGIM
ncbi:hypothetical protein KC19_VG196000 [Ceratodon purpureus]|uniref:Uncharacterized protein n=1 Tax=Ceratodon purpureus TaxID=3225 RepID=A0A8T0HSA0_CERPU|nr:hypothetical protein KC19_VG196000 [Ceratodon purpureus]